MKFLPLVLANLRRHRLRTILTMCSVALALFLFASLRTVVTTLNAEFGKTIMMVTHDPRAAERATTVLHLEKGALLERAMAVA